MPYGLTKKVWDSITNPDVKEMYMQTGWDRKNFVATLTRQRLERARKDLLALNRSGTKIRDIDNELKLRKPLGKRTRNLGAWANEFVKEWEGVRAATRKRRDGKTAHKNTGRENDTGAERD